MRCHSPHVQSLCLASSCIHPRPSHGMVMGARAVATSSGCSPDRGRLTSLGHPSTAHRGRSDYSSPQSPALASTAPAGRDSFHNEFGYRRMLGLACATAQSSCNEVHAQSPPVLPCSPIFAASCDRGVATFSSRPMREDGPGRGFTLHVIRSGAWLGLANASHSGTLDKAPHG